MRKLGRYRTMFDSLENAMTEGRNIYPTILRRLIKRHLPGVSDEKKWRIIGSGISHYRKPW
jgi:hypothetical protein